MVQEKAYEDVCTNSENLRELHAASPANDLFNGNVSPEDMDATNLANNAERIKKEADKITEKELGGTKPIDDLGNALTNATSGMSMGGAGFDSGSDPTNMSPQQAASLLEKEIEQGTTYSVNSPSSHTSGGGGTDSMPEEKLEFGLTQEAAAAQAVEVAEVMDKEFDMEQNNNDISKGSDTNIFQVLSNRYQRSGMRRLFNDGGKNQVDQPAKTDITQ
jgi:hypothetical protein